MAALLTRWQITFGTYGSRIHGGDRPTVDRRQNTLGEDYIVHERGLELYRGSLAGQAALELTPEQRCLIEQVLPAICQRAGCTYIQAAAAPDHVHIVLRGRAAAARKASAAVDQALADRGARCPLARAHVARTPMVGGGRLGAGSARVRVP